MAWAFSNVPEKRPWPDTFLSSEAAKVSFFAIPVRETQPYWTVILVLLRPCQFLYHNIVRKVLAPPWFLDAASVAGGADRLPRNAPRIPAAKDRPDFAMKWKFRDGRPRERTGSGRGYRSDRMKGLFHREWNLGCGFWFSPGHGGTPRTDSVRPLRPYGAALQVRVRPITAQSVGPMRAQMPPEAPRPALRPDLLPLDRWSNYGSVARCPGLCRSVFSLPPPICGGFHLHDRGDLIAAGTDGRLFNRCAHGRVHPRFAFCPWMVNAKYVTREWAAGVATISNEDPAVTYDARPGAHCRPPTMSGARRDHQPPGGNRGDRGLS